MKRAILIILALGSLSLCTWPGLLAQEGVFHIATGKQLSQSEWEAQIPDSLYLFDREEPFSLTIESDFKNFSRHRNKDEYQEALLHFHLNDSVLVKRTIRIKPRGVFRKNYCALPPIRLNFKKTEFDIPDLQQLEKIKMVTTCQNSAIYEGYLLKEYLVYKLFNLFTEMSFKVRLLNVRYIDTGRKNKTTETYAFLIEELDKLAARNNATVVEHQTLSQPHMEPMHMTMVAVFNYMIGNTDWSIPGQHNMKLITVNDFSKPKPYPVPYDFDISGVVNAKYAKPLETFGIRHVRERLFRGHCRTDAEFQDVIDLFLAKEEAVQAVIHDCPFLEKKDKKDVLSFINEFYILIRKPAANTYLFQRSCKQ